MCRDMQPFSNSISFTSFVIPAMITQDPDALAETLNNALELLHNATLRIAHPPYGIPVSKVAELLRIPASGVNPG